jgi:hypothetical protein
MKAVYPITLFNDILVGHNTGPNFKRLARCVKKTDRSFDTVLRINDS